MDDDVFAMTLMYVKGLRGGPLERLRNREGAKLRKGKSAERARHPPRTRRRGRRELRHDTSKVSTPEVRVDRTLEVRVDRTLALEARPLPLVATLGIATLWNPALRHPQTLAILQNPGKNAGRSYHRLYNTSDCAMSLARPATSNAAHSARVISGSAPPHANSPPTLFETCTPRLDASRAPRAPSASRPVPLARVESDESILARIFTLVGVVVLAEATRSAPVHGLARPRADRSRLRRKRSALRGENRNAAPPPGSLSRRV